MSRVSCFLSHSVSQCHVPLTVAVQTVSLPKHSCRSVVLISSESISTKHVLEPKTMQCNLLLWVSFVTQKYNYSKGLYRLQRINRFMTKKLRKWRRLAVVTKNMTKF